MGSTDVLSPELFSLNGKTAIVTGATGGLGSSMTLALAEAGANIVSIQQPHDSLGPTLQKAIHKAGQSMHVFECDLADSTALRATIHQMWEAGVVPDILLNCAGINRRGKIETMQDPDIDLVCDLRSSLS
jgi:2-deoxy-D-gluconate 3-dehydrogenase